MEAQLARVREALARPSFVFAVPGRDGDDALYLVRQGRVVGEARCRDPLAVQALQAQAQAPAAAAVPSAAAVAQLDELLLVESWFRLHPEAGGWTAPTVEEALARFTQAGAPTP